MQSIKKRKIFPTFYAATVEDITPGFVLKNGFTALLVDIDNTLSHVDAPYALPEAESWMKQMKNAGIKLGFVSNNDSSRVEPFAHKYAAEFVCHAQKPSPHGYLAMAQKLNKGVDECLVIGDQLFTDILGGNAAGMRTLIVDPICEAEDPKGFRKRRKLEKMLLYLDGLFKQRKRALGG